MRPLSCRFEWICLLVLTFGLELWSLITIYVHTGAYPEHIAFRFFKLSLPLGIHRYDLLFMPAIWPALLLLVLPNSLQWARGELRDRLGYLVRLAAAALFGIATSVVIGSTGFDPFEIVFCMGILAVVGILFGLATGFDEEHSDRLEFTLGDFGLIVSYLIALLCGVVTGILALLAYGIPFFFSSEALYGLRVLIRMGSVTRQKQ